jgi:hypothetical protein
MEQRGSHWTFFIYVVEVLLKSVEKIQIWLKLDKSNTLFRGELRTFMTSLVTSVTIVAIVNNQ